MPFASADPSSKTWPDAAASRSPESHGGQRADAHSDQNGGSFSSWMDRFSDDKQPASQNPVKKKVASQADTQPRKSSSSATTQSNSETADSEKLTKADSAEVEGQDSALQRSGTTDQKTDTAPITTPVVPAAPTPAQVPLAAQLALGLQGAAGQDATKAPTASDAVEPGLDGMGTNSRSIQLKPNAFVVQGLPELVTSSDVSSASNVKPQGKAGLTGQKQSKAIAVLDPVTVHNLLGSNVSSCFDPALFDPATISSTNSSGGASSTVNDSSKNPGGKAAVVSELAKSGLATQVVEQSKSSLVDTGVSITSEASTGPIPDSAKSNMKAGQNAEVAFTATIKEATAASKSQNGGGNTAQQDSQGKERNQTEASPNPALTQPVMAGEKALLGVQAQKVIETKAPADAGQALSATSDQPAAVGTAKSISLNVDTQNPGVSIQLVERGGTIQVSVRSQDTQLTGDIRSRLNELVDNLTNKGFEAQTWTPDAGLSDVKRATQQRSESSSEPTTQLQQPVAATMQAQNHTGNLNQGDPGNGKSNDDATSGRQSKGDSRGGGQQNGPQDGDSQSGDEQPKNLFRSVLEGARP